MKIFVSLHKKAIRHKVVNVLFVIPFVVVIVRFTEITAIAAVVYNFNLLLFPCFIVVVYCLLFFFIIIPFAECNQWHQRLAFNIQFAQNDNSHCAVWASFVFKGVVHKWRPIFREVGGLTLSDTDIQKKKFWGSKNQVFFHDVIYEQPQCLSVFLRIYLYAWC